MRPEPFRLERFFAQHEFTAPYLLCSSDCQTITVKELMAPFEDGLDRFLGMELGYTDSRGGDRLRELIAAQYKGLNDSQVLVHTGAEEPIFNFMNSVLSPGDHLITHWPCYQSLFEIGRAIGAEVTPWETWAGSGWALDLDWLADNLRPETKAVVVNLPHNPTGYLASAETYRGLIDLAEERGFLVFSDEVYRGLEYDPADRLPSGCEVSEQVVSLGVLSKAHGLAGLRVGWVATRNKAVLEAMAGFKDYLTICNSGPSEILAEMALERAEELIGRNLEIIRSNLVLLDEFFRRRSGLFEWVRPKAGPIGFPALKQGEAETFCRDLVDKTGVLLAPGTNWGPEFTKNFRIGFGRANMDQALARLDEYLG